jgi:hypothetical protein
MSNKLSTVAIALALTTMSMGITSCSDATDCDSDTTNYADATDNGSYDVTDADPSDPYADGTDVGAYDTTHYADTTCD